MAGQKSYTLHYGRLKRGFRQGYYEEPGKELCLNPAAVEHIMIINGLDSAEPECIWGRFRIRGNFGKECILKVYAFASDEKEFLRRDDTLTGIEEFLHSTEWDIAAKKQLFRAGGAVEFTGQKDFLLYGQRGRYLWIMVEILGSSNGEIQEIFINSPGDNFMNTFPEVYQEYGSFFHRYMSVFSSIYFDFEEKIEHLHQYLDIQTAPVEFLYEYAGWLGLEVKGNFLSEERLRRLLAEAYSLQRGKGTKKSLNRLFEIILDEEAAIVERNLIEPYLTAGDYEIYNSLYGSSPMDITVLLNRERDEMLKAHMLYFIEQFKPVRSKVNLVFLQECSYMDSYCYLDVNAVMQEIYSGAMDSVRVAEGRVILS